MTDPPLSTRVASLTGPDRAVDAMCQCPLHTLIPMRIADLIEPTLADLEAACALIGNDTYGKPHWTPDTINPCNPVVQAFARHAAAALKARGL